MVQPELPISVLFHDRGGTNLFARTNDQNDPDATSDSCRIDCSMQKARSSGSLVDPT
jgi:hypothetical protein